MAWACVLTLKWKRHSEAELGRSFDPIQSGVWSPLQVFLVHVLSSCCHVSVLLALRFHCPLGMSQGYLAFHLKVPVTFCQVLSALVVQTETSGWREPIALENYSNDSRCHCWAGVFAKCFLWTTRCHCAVILCAPSRGQEEFHFHPKSNFSVVFLFSAPGFFSCPCHVSVSFTLSSVSGL